MSLHKRRIEAIQALLAGSRMTSPTALPAIVNATNTVIGEFSEAINAGRIRKNDRKQLLQVLHTTRALDTSLATLIAHYSIPLNPHRSLGLGTYLHGFVNHHVSGLGHLPEIQRAHYQSVIVNVRNRYLHNAGAYPTSTADIQNLITEMHNCLVDIMAL